MRHTPRGLRLSPPEPGPGPDTDGEPEASLAPRPAELVGPFFLAVFAYAGQLKASPLLAWLPVDLTTASAALVLLAALASRLHRGPTPGAFGAPIVVFGCLQLGLWHSSFDGYAQTKILTLWTFTAVAILAPFHLLRTPRQRTAFLAALVAVGSTIGLFTYLSPAYASEYSNIVVFAGANTIGTARAISTAVTVCLVLAAISTASSGKRIALALASFSLMGVTLASGSRGPFLGLGFATLVAILTSPQAKRIRVRAIVLVSVVASVALVWAARAGSDGFNRVFDFLSGEQDNSNSVRLILWRAALDSSRDSLTGIGWGNFAQIQGMWRFATPDGRLYPHNVLLEAFAEAGWVSGIALLAYLVASLRHSRLFAATTTDVALYALLVFTIVNSMVSGDVNDNRLMWMTLSAAWLLKTRARGPSDHLPRPKVHHRGSGPRRRSTGPSPVVAIEPPLGGLHGYDPPDVAPAHTCSERSSNS